MRIRYSYFLSSLIVVLLTACAGPTIVPESSSLSVEALLAAEQLTGETDLPEVNDIDVLAMDQDMLRFLDKHVNRERRSTLKLHELLYAIITEGTFGLEYDEITRTAQETF